jgi:hypothetical protein
MRPEHSTTIVADMEWEPVPGSSPQSDRLYPTKVEVNVVVEMDGCDPGVVTAIEEDLKELQRSLSEKLRSIPLQPTEL